MKYDKEKNQLILQLRKLRKLKNDKPYRDLKNAIMKKYSVTERAVQIWLNRKNPGLRKSRNDAGKDRVRIIPKETQIVNEMLKSGVDIKTIKATVRKKTGKEISDRKLSKIRDRIEQNSNVIDENKKSNFGDSAKELFRKLFELDLMAPDNGISLKVGKDKFVIPKQDVEDVCLILGNAWNRSQSTESKRKKIDRALLRKQMILHLMEQQIRIAAETGSTKDVESLTRMYDRMTENYLRDANIKVVEKICKHFKPDIQFDEIVSLIDDFTEEE